MKSLISVLNIFFHENSYLTALIFRLVVRVTVFAYSSTLGNNVAGETKFAFLGTSLQRKYFCFPSATFVGEQSFL